MGRKKKKGVKPWCWYCNREFDDEKILIQHQKAKHFKCRMCNKKLFTGPGLAIHCMQVHKETIDKIPGAIPGRDSIDVEVYGMEGIPQEYDGTAEPKAKKPTLATPTTSTPAIPGFPMSGALPALPMATMATPYVTGQFFGARPQYPTLPAAASLIKPAFTPALPKAFPALPAQTSVALAAAAAAANTANIPLPGSIPTPSVPQIAAATFSAYQQKSTVPTPAVPEAYSSAPVHHNLPSTSAVQPPTLAAQPSVLTVQKPLGSKTRIVVPDENISLEENMAQRLELLAQVRYR